MKWATSRAAAIEYRWGQDQYDRLPDLAVDLVRRQVRLIAAHDTLSAIAANASTTTMPIVFAGGGNPVSDGLVTSLNRPDRQRHRYQLRRGGLGAKQLGLLREREP